MLYMWLLETWEWMEPLSQIRTKQIMWQWSQNRVALQKGVLSSSNSLWRDSARKSNSHDELKRRNCQDRLIDWPYIIFFAVGLADRLCLDIACSLVFRYMTWLRVMNTNVTRHEAINCIALIYKSCTVSKNLLLHKGIQYPPPPGMCSSVLASPSVAKPDIFDGKRSPNSVVLRKQCWYCFTANTFSTWLNESVCHDSKVSPRWRKPWSVISEIKINGMTKQPGMFSYVGSVGSLWISTDLLQSYCHYPKT